MSEDTARPGVRRRRIIDRPRLMRLLDEASSQIRMLIAPAGYGKTTLAEQWADRPGRRSTWYRARNASSDVAVLAIGLADAAATILPDCNARLRQRLSVTADPSVEAELLAEILAEDIGTWPDDAWLVIDDHHLLDGSAAANVLVQTLTLAASIRLLIISRTRPSWVSSRDVLYGDVLEIGQAALAMDAFEAEQVLTDWRPDRASGLMALADGWPAVIGLAGIAPPPDMTKGALPVELYAFFAEEVLQTLQADTRAGLPLLAVPPTVDDEIASAILGASKSRPVCREALAAGVMHDRAGRWELHPLARDFLLSHGRSTPEARTRAALAALTILRERRDWDAAFEVIEHARLISELESLLSSALDELLAKARLATIGQWLQSAPSQLIERPVFRLARAELTLRQGQHFAALTHAKSAIDSLGRNDPWAYRVYFTAAEAAHVACHEDEALSYFAEARNVARDASEQRDALLGEVMCMAELEDTRAVTVLQEVSETLDASDPRALVREAGRRLSLGLRFGKIPDLTFAWERQQLLAEVNDPIARSSFLCGFSCSLALRADYLAAFMISRELVTLAENYRLRFVSPYGWCVAAAAKAGMRHTSDALHLLDIADAESVATGNIHAQLNGYAFRLRALLHAGRSEDALSLTQPEAHAPLRNLATEIAATQALAYACSGHLREAEFLLDQARGQSQSIEPRVLIPTVDAVIAAKRNSPGARSTAASALAIALESGAIDLLVTGYRGSPELFELLLTSPSSRESMLDVLRRARDEQLVRDVGLNLTVDPRRSALTRREREIYDLVAEGLSNDEIASRLYLSPATVKLHVHHVYAKTGVKSRTALVLQAARERQDQATDAARDRGVS